MYHVVMNTFSELILNTVFCTHILNYAFNCVLGLNKMTEWKMCSLFLSGYYAYFLEVFDFS